MSVTTMATLRTTDPDHAASTLQPQFLIIPSLACPARCAYCFGPHQGPVMSPEIADATADFIARIATEAGLARVRITFHGGEPLMASPALFRRILTGLSDRLGADRLRLALQSNLWRLDDELCALFQEHRVEIGTSLDGPEAITDAQRGSGYFARTLAGIRRAQAHGLQPGCIATFTTVSAPRWREVFDFFLDKRLNFSIHPAVTPLGCGDTRHTLPPAEYGRLLCEIADRYIAHRREIEIASLDQVCQSLGTGQGGTCTFRECLGMFLAIDPEGAIYSCQRFCGHPQWRLGYLVEHPSLAELLASPVARQLERRQKRIAAVCGDCSHLHYCHGGCPYNAIAASGDLGRDPYCSAYRTLFDHLQTRLSAEMAAPENLDAVTARPWCGRGHPFLRRGSLIELVRNGPHPAQVARTAKRIVAAVELARGPDLPAIAARLVAMGICRTQASGEASLSALRNDLFPAARARKNLYLHVTWRCQLHCNHCYARGDAKGRDKADLPIAVLERLLVEAGPAGFRQVVLTGGEPLLFCNRDGLLELLVRSRGQVKPVVLVLRSNLALPLDAQTLRRVAMAVDRVIVSVDGDEVTHDARRGAGSYAATLRNLEAYRDCTAGLSGAAELFLTATLLPAESVGPPAQAVRDLANRLGIQGIRFRPVLPLGRGAELVKPPQPFADLDFGDPMRAIESGFGPVAGCGLGQHLYVEPSGDAFPCYAYRCTQSYLGNVVEDRLAAVIGGDRFMALTRSTVDTDAICGRCDLRYLCGGGCRAWLSEHPFIVGKGSRADCAALQARSQQVLQSVYTFLEIPLNWRVQE